MVDKLNKILVFVGLTWLTPVIKLAAGENPGQQVRDIWTLIGVPVSAFVSFLMLWSLTAAQIETSLGNIPGPMQAYQQAVGLWEEHVEEREKARASISGRKSATPRNWAANPQAKSRSANIPASRRISTRSALACTRFSLAFRWLRWWPCQSACFAA